MIAPLSPSGIRQRAIFESAYNTLKALLIAQVGRSRCFTSTGVAFINPSTDLHYHGIWPDDTFYPLWLLPELMTNDELAAILDFVTDSVIDLGRLPDRIEPDGMPILSPGMYDSPHTSRMPLHLPAAWVRMLDYCQSRGITIPRKRDWANVIRRNYESIPFACGLVYVDPQFPCVGYGFYDGVAITGWELMCSLIHYRGLQRTANLFSEELGTEEVARFKNQSQRAAANLHRLFDNKVGGFVAGSRDCHQFSVWGNGLAYFFANDGQRGRIVDFYRNNRDQIFVRGCAKQIAEETGWQRMLTPSTLGQYMHGGAWATGTGYVLPAIADRDPGFAAELVAELVETVTTEQAPEWLHAHGSAAGAKQFNASLALPMLGLKSILTGTPLIDFF